MLHNFSHAVLALTAVPSGTLLNRAGLGVVAGAPYAGLRNTRIFVFTKRAIIEYQALFESPIKQARTL